MEGKRYRVAIIFLLFFVSVVQGTNNQDIYNAYILNNMPRWKVIIDQIETKAEKSNELLIELVNYQYGYIAWCIGTNHKDEAQNYLRRAEENLKLLENRRFALSKVYGYKSAFYGFHIGLNIFSAPFIGPKSMASAKQALTTDPDDFFGYIQMGNVQFHAPSMFGGSKQEALKNYLKAKVLMEKNIPDFAKDWNYISLLSSIAQAYEQTDDLVRAKLIYEEILKYEPRFTWVRDELYPKLLKRLK